MITLKCLSMLIFFNYVGRGERLIFDCFKTSISVKNLRLTTKNSNTVYSLNKEYRKGNKVILIQ